MREKLSAFVVSHNRAAMLETCLRAVSFADEIIVIDKESTDGSAAVAAGLATRVEVVPWTPIVEDTRAYAASLCSHAMILFLDDDEILSPETGPYLRDELDFTSADIFALPLRHYILGVHDERAYYWPETHYRLYRKGAIEFIPRVHGGVVPISARIATLPADRGVCIHHLSHPDVASWIERANRYTSFPDRARAEWVDGDLIRFAQDRIDLWHNRGGDRAGDGYPAAAALLRAIYDMIDRLKSWEEARGLNGAAQFQQVQMKLAPAIGARQPREEASPPPVVLADPAMEIRGLMVRLRAAEAASRERAAAAHRDAAALAPVQLALKQKSGRLDEIEQALAETSAALTAARLELAETRAELNGLKIAQTGTAVALDGAMTALAETRLAQTHVSAALSETAAALSETRAELTLERGTHRTARAEYEAAAVALSEARRSLSETQASLAVALGRLDQTQALHDRISGSARHFLRQYWPKLRRHVSRRLAAWPIAAARPEAG